VKRCNAKTVCGLQICAMGREIPNNVKVSSITGKVKRRLATIVCGFQIRSMVQKTLNGGKVTFLACQVKRRGLDLSKSSVDIGAIL